MLRNIFVFTLMLGGIRLASKNALGCLQFYLWLAYFRPEAWLWDSAWIQALNLSFLAGLFLLFRAVTASDKHFRFDVRSALLFTLLLISLLSTLTTPYWGWAWVYWQEFAKIIIISYLLSSLVRSEADYRQVLLVIALSVGFEAAKQGWIGMVLHPGAKNSNYIAIFGDENGVAVGMLILAPLCLVLAQTSTRRWERWVHRALAIGVLYRGISTYSRGGFLAAGACLIVYVLRSKRKVPTFIGMVVVASALLSFMPQEFWDRMSTIKVNESEMEDSSASRLHFWRVATLMANAHPLLGVGHNSFNLAYNQYDFSRGQFGKGRSVHSSWFGMLAELGYPAFIIYVAIIFLGFASAWRVASRAKSGKSPPTLYPYAVGLQAAFAAFIVGGSFVPHQYLEMLWHLVALSIALRQISLATATVPEPVLTPEAAPRFTGGFQPTMGRA
jgi:probable O-glycosylation ligase (exosortase A-associated)